MPTKTNEEQFIELAQFRQTIYEQYLTQARDAQFELIDALLLSPAIPSFPHLSRSPVFRRQWHSAYAAVRRGRQDRVGLRRYLCQQVPAQAVNLYALDKSAWHHPRARTLEDLLYERSPAPSIAGHAIVKAHPYSFLSWVPARHSSWAMLYLSMSSSPPCYRFTSFPSRDPLPCQLTPFGFRLLNHNF